MVDRAEPAVIVKNVYKSFRLPHEQHSGLKQFLLNLFRRPSKRVRGYETQHVLEDISFEIKKGEFFGIVGRNGSGKSTLLKLLAGIYTADRGKIGISGSLTPFIELGVGFNPELTGRENVYLNGALLGFSHEEMDKMYDDIVEFAELEKFMDQRLKNYSSGMQVRLAFSIAIRANSDILLIDEVLAVGDANFQKKCYGYFDQLRDQQKTVILVTHDMEAVRRFCNQALLLENGSIVEVGSPGKIGDLYIKSNITKDQKSPAKGKKTSQDIYINDVKIYNSQSQSLPIKSGDSVTIEVLFTAQKSSLDFNVGIGVHSITNGYVLGYNTQMDKICIEKTQGGGVVRLNFARLPLNSGEYYINAVCFGADEALPFDLRTEITHFIVENPDQYRYRGVLRIDHHWDVTHE